MTYYQPFLSTVFFALNDALVPRKLSASVCGYTLPGFRLQPGCAKEDSLPASLKEQIEHTEQLIRTATAKHMHGTNSKRPKVVLLAHSAGTNITMEILKRYTDGHNALSGIDIIGAVLLCPTIARLAESNNGRIAAVSPLTIISCLLLTIV